MSQTFGAWRATYTPGSWVVLAGPSSLVVMQPAAPRHSGLVSSIWRQVAEAESPESLVKTLSAIGLAKMPSLGLFFWTNGEMYSLARGQIVVKDASTGEVVNHGDDLLTWSEKKLGPATVIVEMEQAEQGLSMPLLLGVAQASKLIIDATGTVEPFVVPQTDDVLRPWISDSGKTPDDEGRTPGFVEVPAPGEVPESTPLTGAATTDEIWGPDREDAAAGYEPVSSVPAHAAVPGSVEGAGGGETQDESVQTGGEVHTGSQPVGVHPEFVDVVAALAPDTAAKQLDEPRFDQSQGYSRDNDDWRFVSASTASRLSSRSDAAAATLVSSTGEVAHLDRPVLIGRAPRSENGEGIMRVPSPRQDISRTHVRFAPGQWGIEVTDMHSTNGTIIHRVGQEPLQLESGQTVDLSTGDSVDLGDGVVVTIEAYRG